MAKQKDNKPRGRMSSYAYFVQKTREDFKKKHPNENVVFSEFSKKCSDTWKKMSDSEKKKFIQMADKDKKRYESEMRGYVPPKDSGKKKGKKAKKDPNAPKRALSAFFWFCNDERNRVKASLPAGSGVGDVSKECARLWGGLSAAQKQKYDALAAKDKLRYEREIAAYRKKAEGGSPKKGKKGKKAETSDSDD